MKKRVLIVEDDKYFRFAVKKYVDWNKYGFQIVGEAVHGEVALAFLESQFVEVVVTDMSMPIMNGVELTAAIKERFPEILVIALSAYDDFEFVKESLKLGAGDYILKQDMEKENVAYLVEKAWKKHMTERLGESRLKDSVIRFFQGDDTQKQAERYLQLCLGDKNNFYLCVVRNLSFEWEHTACRNCGWIEPSFLEWHGKNEHMILFPAIRDASIRRKVEYREQKIRELESLLQGERYFSGCSSLLLNGTELRRGYQQVQKSIEISCFLKQKKILLWDEIDQAYKNRKKDFLEESRNYKDVYTLKEAGQMLQVLVEKMRVMMPDEKHVQKNFLVFVNAIAANMKLTMDQTEYSDLKEELLQYDLLDEKKDVAKTYISQIFECCKQETLHVSVRKGIRYMQDNFNKELSLSEIATHVALNDSYFSNLFHKETGKGITEYLNWIRIVKAKKLIEETNLKSYEIARKVGIVNASYFSTVFKKETGMTVQEYRQQFRFLKKSNQI